MSDLLSESGLSHRTPTPDVISQLLQQQTHAWKSGEEFNLELLLQRYTKLAARADSLLDLIHNEIYWRRKKGQLPELQEYQRRFPAVAEQLKIQWEIDRLLFTESSAEIDTGATRNWTVPHQSTTTMTLPTVLGSYEILEILGQGGMGAVYKARHLHLGKPVALKVLSHRVTGRAIAVERFKREMKAVGTLNHPHIIQAFDAGEVDGIHFIAMELVDGVDLHRLVKERGPLPIADACLAISQAASALAEAHSAGLIHRDVKPSNMMIADRHIKLLDLGLARLIEEEDDELLSEFTATSQTFGTPDFMAPEQWDNAHLVDHRADLYSLGCTLFYLLVGRPPYGTGEYRTASRKMRGHLMDPVPDLKALRPDVPDGVASICNTLLAKRPRDRFSSATALRLSILPYVAEATLISSDSGSGMLKRDLTAEPQQSRELSGHAVAVSSQSGSVTRSARRAPIIIGATAILGVTISLGLVAAILSARGQSPLEVLRWGFRGKPPVAPAIPQPQPGGNGAGTAAKMTAGDAANARAATATRLSAGQGALPADITGTRVELWKEITPAVVSDGNPGDVKITGDVIALDASARSPQLWLDFQKQTGNDISLTMDLRIANIEEEGYFKLVFLHNHQWSNEYYLQIRRRAGKLSMNLSLHDRQGQHILTESPIFLKDNRAQLRIMFAGPRMAVAIDGKLQLEAKRDIQKLGTLAIAIHGWQAEVTRPVLIIR